MDASTGANKNGNGHADPLFESLPSAVAAPSGAPVSDAIAAPAAGAPEPLIVVDDEVRDPITGKIKKGKSLNPAGRPPGIPNKNTEFLRLLTAKELREVWKIAKTRAKAGDVGLMEFLLERALIKVTPESAGIVINNNPSAHAGAAASSSSESYGNARKLLADETGRELLARCAERLASGSVDSGTPRHVRQ